VQQPELTGERPETPHCRGDWFPSWRHFPRRLTDEREI
jgi:hypothetical protein